MVIRLAGRFQAALVILNVARQLVAMQKRRKSQNKTFSSCLKVKILKSFLSIAVLRRFEKKLHQQPFIKNTQCSFCLILRQTSYLI